MSRTLTTLLLFAVLWGTLHAEGFVWWEGESAAETNFPARTWFSAKGKETDVLSGGRWLSNEGKRKGPEAFAKYKVAVPEEGEYALWTRKFWKHGSFRWRFDQGVWQTCGRDAGLADSVTLRKHVCANWVHLGKVKLAKGKHTFELRLLAKEGEGLTAAFDCFLLTGRTFIPRGRLRPGEISGLAEPGWWAFEPRPDPFGKAMLDLRHLNEKTAGENGFIRRIGSRFARSDGTAVRFWGVNAGRGIVELSHEHHDYLARRLAKLGVNIVRIHAPVFDGSAADPTTVDPKYLDRLHHFVAALKGQGIYVSLSFYFPLWFDVKPSYGIEGYDTIRNRKPFALLFFDARMQEIHRTWARTLLTTLNPYTKRTLVADPAVAFVEIVNEDSFFFWTFTRKNVPEAQMRKLEKRFDGWVRQKHGSLDKAFTAWGAGGRRKEDAPGEGRLHLFDAWFMTADGVKKSGVARPRLGDQVCFLTETQKAFYEDTVKFLRKDLGTKSLIVCSNWKTADAVTLGPLERYTYTVGDAIDRHGYFGGKHQGPRSRYAVDVGDKFADRAGVLEPAALPLQFVKVSEYPQIISEIGWPNPNRFKAEFPVLAAAYGSLQGVNGFFLFALNGPDWNATMVKFPVNLPTIMGQFPAAALMYRRGDIAEGELVCREDLGLRELYDFQGGGAITAANLDELRKAGAPANAKRSAEKTIDPLAFYVGQVVRSFRARKSRVFSKDLRPFIDREKRIVRSITGQLTWDYGRGIVTINSPRTQGLTGFLRKAGRRALADVVIESANEFGTVLVTSLDGRPLRTSTRILIQSMTEEKHYGWKVENGRIVALGGYPLNVRNIEANVTLKGIRAPKTVHVLDEHGYTRDTLHPARGARGTTVKLPADAVYTVVEFSD